MPADQPLPSVRGRLWRLEALARVTAVLARLDPLPVLLDETLALLRGVFDCDRAFLWFPCDPNAESAGVQHEQTHPDWPGALAAGQRFSMTPEIAFFLQHALDSEGPERRGPGGVGPVPEPAQRFGVQAQVAVALHPRTGPAWLFGLHRCREARDFSAAEADLVAEVGLRICGALSLRLALERLEASEERLRTLTAAMPVGVFHNDPDGACIYANNAMASMVGLPADQCLGWGWIGALHAEDREWLHATWLLCASAGRPFEGEYRFVHPDGSVRRVLCHMVPVTDAAGVCTGHVGAVTDITERKRAEQRLATLERAIDSASEGVVIAAADGAVEYVNRAFTTVTGLAGEAVVGLQPRPPWRGLRSPIFYEAFWGRVREGVRWAGEIRDHDVTGRPFVVRLSVSPIADGRGRVTHVVGIHEDVSRLDVLDQKLQQAEKFKALGLLSGGIAHDFNNLLTTILGNLFLLRGSLLGQPRLLEQLDEVRDAAGRGAALIAQLLAFARRDPARREPLELRGFVKEVFNLAKAAVSEDVSFTLAGPTEECWVEADAAQLQQVVLNFTSNARDAVRGRARAAVSLGLELVAPGTRVEGPGVEAGAQRRWVRLWCQDNGCGIEPCHQDRVFDPFFTTKAVGEGAGLGLAMVYSTVRAHGGTVEVESQPGFGAVFSVFLPWLDREGEETTEREVAVRGSDECILVVDDEDGVRRTTVLVLEALGYRVRSASDGREALEVVRADPAGIDLVLTDVVMPEMGGVEAAREIRALPLLVPILFQSGHGEHAQLEEARRIPRSALYMKPVAIPELSRALRRLLDGASEPVTPDGTSADGG